MRPAILVAACGAVAVPAGAAAARPVAFAVPAGPLRSAIVAIGDQAGVTIGLTDNALGAIPVRGVQGTMSVAKALSRLLAGTPARFVRIDAQTFQILRATLPARPERVLPKRQALSGTEPAIVLGMRAQDFYKASGDRFPLDCGFVEQGYLMPCFSDAEVAQAKDRVALQKTLGLEVQWLSASDVDEMRTGMAAGATLGSSYAPGDGGYAALLRRR